MLLLETRNNGLYLECGVGHFIAAGLACFSSRFVADTLHFRLWTRFLPHRRARPQMGAKEKP